MFDLLYGYQQRDTSRPNNYYRWNDGGDGSNRPERQKWTIGDSNVTPAERDALQAYATGCVTINDAAARLNRNRQGIYARTMSMYNSGLLECTGRVKGSAAFMFEISEQGRSTLASVEHL